MRLRNITGSREAIAESPYVVSEAELTQCPGTWAERFEKKQPLFIEIGMGKGRFIHTMAKEHPDVNFVGIEKYSSVLLRAIQKMEEEELPSFSSILASVLAPTTPSAVRPFLRWNSLTAAVVLLPKTPSTGPS